MLPVEQRAERLQSETMCNSHFLNFLPPNQIIFLFCQEKLDAELDAKILSAFEDDDEAPRCPISPGDFRFVFAREHGEAFQSLWFPLPWRGHSWRSPSCAECSARPHVCQQFCCFFPSQISLILEDLMGNLLNFPLRITFTCSCQQGSDCTSNKLHMRRCSLTTKQTEWKRASKPSWPQRSLTICRAV